MRTLSLSVCWLLFNALLPFFYSIPLGWFSGPVSVSACTYLFVAGLLTAFFSLFFHYLLFERLARFFQITKAKPLIWVGASALLLAVYSVKFYLSSEGSLLQGLMIGMIPFAISTVWVAAGFLPGIRIRQTN